MTHISKTKSYHNSISLSLPLISNKSCAMCRKKSTLQAAVRLFPQFDDEPSDAEQRLMSRIDEMETKLVMLRSEVESLKAENRQLKSSVENTKDKYVDYKEFIEDFANDLMKQAKKIDQFRLNMSDPHREEDVLMRSKATFYTKYARKRSLPQPGNENMMKKKRNE